MTLPMRWKWVLAGLAAILVLILALAWIDGGHEPVREIAVPVEVPEMAG